ncbi:phospho-N-acetylmuramoyl-pentapeptide-transferase, partial [uncultured Chitinophaga sp.]|uniref:phospho-N-acetylmuramoyl-pentapeptide- transferase n=2 Tax=Chitinophaga TaxID=79328 RepID=UPI00263968C6
MLYYLFTYLKNEFNYTGTGMWQFITFRVTMALLLSLVISLLLGKRIVRYLQRKQIGETIRDLGLAGEQTKKGTPTMGGLIILSAIVIPTLLFARVMNVYILLILLCTIWLGLIGFIDDYIKVFKKNKEGLAGRFKILGQVGLGLIVGTTLYFNENVVMSREIMDGKKLAPNEKVVSNERVTSEGQRFVDVKTPITTIPFVKNHEFNYAKLISWIPGGEKFTFVIYILIVIIIITAVSNGANITDGLDGLAAGESAIAGCTLGIVTLLNGQTVAAVMAFILVASTIGFLPYNFYPARTFMGDCGSNLLGFVLGCLAILGL